MFSQTKAKAMEVGAAAQAKATEAHALAQSKAVELGNKAHGIAAAQAPEATAQATAAAKEARAKVESATENVQLLAAHAADQAQSAVAERVMEQLERQIDNKLAEVRGPMLASVDVSDRRAAREGASDPGGARRAPQSDDADPFARGESRPPPRRCARRSPKTRTRRASWSASSSSSSTSSRPTSRSRRSSLWRARSASRTTASRRRRPMRPRRRAARSAYASRERGEMRRARAILLSGFVSAVFFGWSRRPRPAQDEVVSSALFGVPAAHGLRVSPPPTLAPVAAQLSRALRPVGARQDSPRALPGGGALDLAQAQEPALPLPLAAPRAARRG